MCCDKNYIEREYKLAVLCFKTAVSEDEKWSCRRSMASLEAIAMQQFGFEYADSLSKFKGVE